MPTISWCWLRANAGYAPMLAMCQCWLCANAGYAPMLAMCQCWLSVNAVAHQACMMRFSHHAVTPTMPTSVEAPIVSVNQGALVQYSSNSNVLVLSSHLTTCVVLCCDWESLSKILFTHGNTAEFVKIMQKYVQNTRVEAPSKWGVEKHLGWSLSCVYVSSSSTQHPLPHLGKC